MIKKVLLVVGLMVSMSGFAQNIVYHSGNFTASDAMLMASTYNAGYAVSTYNSYEPYVITSDGKINGNNLGNIENVLQFFNDVKTSTSTEMYTITPYMFGTKEIVFKGNNKKYYITPYLRRDVVRTIKAYLNSQK